MRLKQFIKDTWVELAMGGVLLIGTGVMLTGVFIGATDEVDNVPTVEQAEVAKVQEPTPIEPIDTVTRADIEADIQAKIDSGYYDALELLARLIHCENSNEVDGEEACWKTGSVVINRINNASYPDTLEGVIYDKEQYDCTGKLYKEEPTDIEYEVAAELLNSGSVIPDSVVFAAEFEQGSGEWSREGRTIYCYE